ncbi:hypothetical protein ES703_23998 [subsurface metagenome]
MKKEQRIISKFKTMPIFKIKGSKLGLVKEKQIGLEKDIQKLTEANVEPIFGLEFVASEFNLENFWLDTLAFNTETQAFVVIEYKKKQNISIMDQGQTYLNLLLDHKAEVLLEYDERRNKNLKRKDINWDQTRVMFVAPNFTPYQKRALHPKLPFELWEVKKYDDNLISYNQIQPLILTRTGQPAPSLSGSAAKEIVINTPEDIIKKSSPFQKNVIREIEEKVLELGDNIKEVAGKDSITFKTQKPFLQLWPTSQKNSVTLYFCEGHKLRDDKNLLKGRGKIGRHIKISSPDQIPDAMYLIKQAYEKAE